jgi:hypothetical protein
MTNIDEKEVQEFVENIDKEEIQKLSMEFISKASEKYENIKEVELELEIDGENKKFVVELYKHFSPISIKKCISEFVEKMERAKIVDKNGFGNITQPYLIFLIIKHFTTLNLPESFEEQILTLEKMVNTGILFKIFLNFDEEEIKKINDELEFILNNFDKNKEIVEGLKKEFRNKIENKFLLD